MSFVTFQLVAPQASASSAPVLSPAQQRVVDHGRGPLLVLAGPGTGKTTTLVEAVAAKISQGTDPERMLILTFSRKAALELRDRIGARLAGTTLAPQAMTFHSFCLAVVRQHDEEKGSELRLLTAPDQDIRLRELLRDALDTDWPAELRLATGTSAFAGEIRSLLARARQLGLDPEDLEELGRHADRPAWSAAGAFFEDYLTMTDFEGSLDYAELVHRARLLLARADTGEQIRARFDWVYVDEYQDTDPAQVGLLRSLVGRGGNIVAVGDPDQSIYRFRGAHPRSITDFSRDYGAPGVQVPVVALAQTRRFGAQIAAAVGNVVAKLPVIPGLPREVVESFRHPECLREDPGQVEAWHCDSSMAQAEHIADALRRAHLDRGIPWSEMAVLVRNGKAQIPALARALLGAGVPLAIAGDEIPLAHDPAVEPLLLALSVAGGLTALDGATADRLLSGPLAGLDAVQRRRLGRALRHADTAAAVPRPSSQLCALMLADPAVLPEIEGSPEVCQLQALAALLSKARALAESGASVDEVLWLLWSGTSWPATLQAASVRGGDAGRAADRDLDAILALFDVAKRSVARRNRGIAGFLADVAEQEIPADMDREADIHREAVRILTAHRAKGLEWSLVVVAGVQEGAWPDLRRRGTLLDADLLEAHGAAVAEPRASLLAEERRLFYVACSRAKAHLIVTAVAATDGEGEQPSRFLDELAVPIQDKAGRPTRPHTLPGLIAELRRVSVDPRASAELRFCAIQRLAELSQQVDSNGQPLAPLAHPRAWWGTAAVTQLPTSLEAQSQGEIPVATLSASTLESLLRCPRQWYLGRKARADLPTGFSQQLGTLIHALVEHSAKHNVGLDELIAELHRVWPSLTFSSEWQAEAQLASAEECLRRYERWRQLNSREMIGTEVPFTCMLDTPYGPVQLRGQVDRLERTAPGGLVVVDFKTGKSALTGPQTKEHAQLGFYQLVIEHGGFAQHGMSSAGAEAVFLRVAPTKAPLMPTVCAQAPLAESGQDWMLDKIHEATRIMVDGSFPATVGEGCKHCVFASSCPADPRGEQVVYS